MAGREAQVQGEVAAGPRGKVGRDRAAAADRVRDQALRSGVHLGEDREETEGRRVARLQHFRQQHREEVSREGRAARQ